MENQTTEAERQELQQKKAAEAAANKAASVRKKQIEAGEIALWQILLRAMLPAGAKLSSSTQEQRNAAKEKQKTLGKGNDGFLIALGKAVAEDYTPAIVKIVSQMGGKDRHLIELIEVETISGRNGTGQATIVFVNSKGERRSVTRHLVRWLDRDGLIYM